MTGKDVRADARRYHLDCDDYDEAIRQGVFEAVKEIAKQDMLKQLGAKKECPLCQRS